MNILGIDAGSSSVRAAILRDGMIASPVARSAFPTRYHADRAEVDAAAVLRALADALRQLGAAARRADVIALANMAPSWIAMDRRGKALTPIITHQDRRSVDVALELEHRVGKSRHLKLAGNRPFPGGISSTTWAWHIRHAPQVLRRADLVGHLSTFLHRHLTGARVTDPSNASFMGVYSTLKLAGWNHELCAAVGASPHLLPEIHDSNRVMGGVTASAAADFRLMEGVPVMTGCMDGSAAMLLAGARPGQMFDVSGSTDVLALCTDRPVPHERLLTRALGIGRLWMSVSTLAAGGTALMWIKEQLFADYSLPQFWKLVTSLASRPIRTSVRFEPYLAGDRMSIEQRQAEFSGLTLSTKRQDMLAALIDALAVASAARLPLLRQGGSRIRRRVMISGGLQRALSQVLHRDWPGKWAFRPEDEATLRGLALMTPAT